MFHPVFAATTAAGSITPVMLSDEFLVRTVPGGLRFAGRGHAQRFPATAATPLILGEHSTVLVFECVAHWQRQIWFAIKRPRDEGDGAPRNQLANENDTTPPFVRTLAPDIKAQVYFLEIAMQRNGQTDHARVEKEKADNADERLAFVEIDLGFYGDERLEDFRIDGEIEHRQVTPVRGEERSHGGSRPAGAGRSMFN